MARILVVDDSTLDRKLACRLLSHEDDHEVLEAGDGRQAVEMLRSQAVDAIVTDLKMPEMDGLSLVRSLHTTHPMLPVVLVTARGSETVAVEALQSGAASYVPKKRMAQTLASTVRTVIDAYSAKRAHSVVGHHTVEQRCTIKLENDPTLVSPTAHYLQQFVRGSAPEDTKFDSRLNIALIEALTNAMYHGNLELTEQMHSDDFTTDPQTIERRRTQPPYRDRRVHVAAYATRDSWRFKIGDDGPGFDITAIPDPRDPENLLKPYGRGITLMRSFLDEVSYNDTGNEVTLVKKVRQPAAQTALA